MVLLVTNVYCSEPAMYRVLFDACRQAGYFVCQQLGLRSARADFMAFAIDWGAVNRRIRCGVRKAITERSLWRVILQLDSGVGASAQDLARVFNLSPAYVRSLLSVLERSGVVEVAGGVPKLSFFPELLFSELRVVEAKLNDWRRAVVQAYRYAYCASELYVALPERQARAVSYRSPDLLRKTGVGVMAVNSSVNILVESRRFHPSPTGMIDQFILSERLWQELWRVLRWLAAAKPYRSLPILPEAVPSGLLGVD